ncbi:MAG: hypothetical protein IJM54_06440 [Thermoguttaceae bacterium]|nr:hypothetical protein [Thermoguttaceae bacterium]
MRLALQALFGARDDSTEESRKRCERIKRELRGSQRSKLFMKKLDEAVSDPDLKAPEIFADESFPDANIVAEYLDCQSESDEIREEYERVCLESPEILAEVGSCYDVLTNRLGRPIDAPKNCRRRLYYVAWEEGSNSGAEPVSDSSEAEHVELVDETIPLCANVAKTERKEFESSLPGESDVQRAMRSERSFGRLAVRFLIKGVLVAATIFGIVCGVFYWSSDKGSETFEIAGSRENADRLNNFGDSTDTTETTNVVAAALSVSGEDLNEDLMPSDFITEDSNFVTEEANSSLASGTGVPEEYGAAYTANLPGDVETREIPTNQRVVKSEVDGRSLPSDGGYGLYSNSGVSRTSRLRRVGLGAPDLELSEGIVIPAQNNDVFARTTRF